MADRPIPPDLKKWVDAKKKCRLSQKHICMAMELGLNPNRLGSLIPNPKEQWKSPLPEFIEEIYEKRFGRTEPKSVRSFVQMVEDRNREKARKKQANQAKKAEKAAAADATSAGDENPVSEAGEVSEASISPLPASLRANVGGVGEED